MKTISRWRAEERAAQTSGEAKRKRTDKPHLMRLHSALKRVVHQLDALSEEARHRLEGPRFHLLGPGGGFLPKRAHRANLGQLRQQSERALEAIEWMLRERKRTGPLPDIKRVYLAACIARALMVNRVRATKSRTGTFARVLTEVLPAAGFQDPADPFALICVALDEELGLPYFPRQMRLTS